MTITIYDPHMGHGFICLKSKHKDFIKEYGKYILIQSVHLYKTMNNLTNWANNELNMECLFDTED